MISGGIAFSPSGMRSNEIWSEVLGDKFLQADGLSRIFYRKKFFYYPLKLTNVLFGLGIVESVRIVLSYLKSRLFYYHDEQNLEQWVSNRFGKRLYEIFFKTYTEKVWGVPCTEIRAEWAAQRIQGLSLTTAISNALFRQKTTKVKTLIEQLPVSRTRAGTDVGDDDRSSAARWLSCTAETPVTRIVHDGRRVNFLETSGEDGVKSFPGSHFISSMPIRDLVSVLDPPAPEEVRRAADRLRYRDFLIVSLIVNRKEIMPDNWIYIHEPGVQVGRIQNFKNWSPAMVPDPAKTCLGMEYFVFENDILWSSPDDKLIELAKKEIEQLGLARFEEIEDGSVVRMPKAYPMYDSGWIEQVAIIRNYLEASFTNLQLVGRNGMHKYNNQDHSMMTAWCAARNIVGANYDLWAINTEAEYHEQKPEKAATLAETEPLRSGLCGAFSRTTRGLREKSCSRRRH